MTTTLLAVDDSKTMRKVLEITFAGEEEYRAVLADSAEDALTKLLQEKPRVVLVDASLRGTSGYDLCQKIKSESPATGVILLSSKQQPYERGRGTTAGVDDFIDKPFDTQQLIEKVGSVAKQAANAPAVPKAAAVAVRPAAPAMPQPGAPATSPIEPRPRVQTLAYGAATQAAPVVSAASAAQVSAGPVRSNSPTQGGVGGAVQSAPATPAARVAPVKPAVAPVESDAAPLVAPVRSAESATRGKPAAAAAPIAAAAAGLESKLNGLGLTTEQVKGVLALSKEVLEQAVWEVVPVLAETMIREEIERLTRE